MLPRAMPVAAYCSRSLIVWLVGHASFGWLPGAAVDLDHRDGPVVESVVVRGAEVEDAGDADEVADLLDLVADLRRVGTRLLHRLHRDPERVPRVAAERRRQLPVGRLVCGGVVEEDRLLGIAVGERARDEELPDGEDDAVR